MIILKGLYNEAKVFTDQLDHETKNQIEILLDQSFVKGSRIRVMPDAHAGAGSTIGTTITVHDKIVPHMVGVDIGCGVEVVELSQTNIRLETLDQVIHRYIPAGFKLRKTPHEMFSKTKVHNLKCLDKVDHKRASLSIGTLGGGNHFIELAKGEDEKLYLLIHSGSRNIGLQVADYYQRLAVEYQQGKSEEGKALIEKLKSQKKTREVKRRLKRIPLPDGMSKSLAWLEGKDKDNYLHDMQIMQEYANINRKAIAKTIVEHMDFKATRSFTTIHNYIDLKHKILRKGAISAQKGEEVLIPINMRDGSLICIGKGNEDWNYSAPHGAGRIMSRREAKQTLNLQDFKSSMKGIFSTTVGMDTLDEAPYAYKPMEEILAHIGDTIEVAQRLVPIYNFKAGG